MTVLSGKGNRWQAPCKDHAAGMEKKLESTPKMRDHVGPTLQASAVSHQQHHTHLWNSKHQTYVPLPACGKKGAPHRCKHGFPKPLCEVARVVCRGNACAFRQSTAGRRNSLGCVLNPRNSQWLSGTMHAFSIMFLGNSHSGVNYRVPLLPEAHDPTCKKDCLSHATLKRLQRVMQRAAQKAILYRLPAKATALRKKELQQAAKHLSLLDAAAPAGSEAQQYRRVLHRICGDLEFRCSVRPLTEEVMLAGFYDGAETTSAECVRSFPVAPFLGMDWLAQVDGNTEQRRTPTSRRSTWQPSHLPQPHFAQIGGPQWKCWPGHASWATCCSSRPCRRPSVKSAGWLGY